jgi:ankyrin repeat protein
MATSGDATMDALVLAIRSGDVGSVETLLGTHEGLASRRILGARGSSCTPLHVATDWPGYFRAAPRVVALLLEAGADPNAPILGGPHAETPLHSVASTDDLDVADVLLDGGADLEARGASIGGGSALDNAVGYGCWHVARRLVERGARVDTLWHASALGLIGRLDELLAATPAPPAEEIDQAFWQACHGGQRRAAEYLLDRGADVNWIPAYADSSGEHMAGAIDTRRELLVEWLGTSRGRSGAHGG